MSHRSRLNKQRRLAMEELRKGFQSMGDKVEAQAREDRHKRRKEIASLQGQAAHLQKKADELNPFLPYHLDSARLLWVCDECSLPLAGSGEYESGSPVNVTAHRRSTCPGIAGRTVAGGGL